jgi:hypothetical protein
MTPAEAQTELDRRAALLLISGELLGQHPGLALLRDALDRVVDTAKLWFHALHAEHNWFLPGVYYRLRVVGLEIQVGNTFGAPSGALRLFQDLRENPVKLVGVLDRIEDVIQEIRIGGQHP